MNRSFLPTTLSILFLTAALTRAEQPTPRAAAPPERDVASWGTQDRVLYHVSKYEFQSLNSGVPYAINTGVYSTVPDGTFGAALHLPSGARVIYLELDYCDFDGPPNARINLLDCSFLGICTVHNNLSSGTGNPGCNYVTMDMTPFNIVVDNNTRTYELFAVTQAGGLDTQIIGAYVGYKLQVSPAPASATFADVPVGHQQFQFVEALFR
jgi:hypothetical protein